MKSIRYAMRSMSEARKMFTYFFSTARGFNAGGGSSELPNALVMAGASLLEHAGDHLVERRVLHAHVHDGVLVENRIQHGRHLAALHLQVNGWPFAFGD